MQEGAFAENHLPGIINDICQEGNWEDVISTCSNRNITVSFRVCK